MSMPHPNDPARAHVLPRGRLQVGDICTVLPSERVPAELHSVALLLVEEFTNADTHADSYFEVALPDDPDTRLEFNAKRVWLHEDCLLFVRSVIPPKKPKRRGRARQ